jgi:hypothetical protein
MPFTGPVVYGEALTPGAPKTWNREVWWALNRAARVGSPAGRHRWRLAPPFHYGSLYVTSGKTSWPYGMSTARRRETLTHLPHTILFAWRRGRLAGRMIAWHCGARTAYFRLAREPGSRVCQMCLFQSRGRVAE